MIDTIDTNMPPAFLQMVLSSCTCKVITALLAHFAPEAFPVCLEKKVLPLMTINI